MRRNKPAKTIIIPTDFQKFIGEKTLKNIIWLLTISVALLGLSQIVSAQNKSFWQTISGRWEGTLEYADYQSNERVKLKTILTIAASADGNSAKFSYVYDDFGKVLKSENEHRIEQSAKKYFIGKDEFSFEEKESEIVLLGAQIDGEKIEPIRTTIKFSSDRLTILKETRTPFAFRHQYTFKRAAQFEPLKTLSPAQMSQDFSIFKRALKQLHPGLYRYNTPAEFESFFKEIEAKLTKPLPEEEFFRLLAQTASQIACGHTYLNPLNQTKFVRAKLFERRVYFPFYFRLIDKKMIVMENISSKKLPTGSEIVKINGVAAGKIINDLLSVTSLDGRGTMTARLKSLELKRTRENQFQTFDVYFPLLFPLKDEIFEIEAVDYQTKKPLKFQVLAMSRAEKFAETERIYGKTPTYEDEWKFQIRDDSTAILKIGNSLTWRLKTFEYKQFIAVAFAEMRLKNVKNLILDWRGNDGGNSDLNIEIIKYLTKTKIDCLEPVKRFVRVSRPDKDLTDYIEVFDEQMRRFLTEGVPENLLKKSVGDLYEFLGKAECETIEPAGNNFTGKTFLITNAENASAAFQFARAIKSNKLAAIVGEETAGNLQGINGGNYFLLRLPNSTFEIDIPVYFQSPTTAQKDSGVVPDFQIKPKIENIADNSDSELNYVFELIKKNQN